MASKVTPFLMFEGTAEEAMNFYVSLFPDAAITHIVRYGSEGPGKEGSVLQAAFTLSGQAFMCIDSPVKHAFTFTPSLSLFVDFESEVELDEAFGRLSAGGEILMAPGNHGFSRKFAWLNDRFGVSWQLNLP